MAHRNDEGRSMTAGRTMWFAQDVARHRRSLMVELQADHGPVALAVDVVLQSAAKEQNDGGNVKTGFAALARESAATAAEVRAFVVDAAAIGWIDDLQIAEDDRRFTCRVSGWASDQDRARAAWKKASQRAKALQTQEKDTGGQGGDTSPVVPKCPPTAQHSTAQQTTAAGREARERESSLPDDDLPFDAGPLPPAPPVEAVGELGDPLIELPVKPARTGDAALDEIIVETTAILLEVRDAGRPVYIEPDALGIVQVAQRHAGRTREHHIAAARDAARMLADPGFRIRSSSRALQIAWQGIDAALIKRQAAEVRAAAQTKQQSEVDEMHDRQNKALSNLGLFARTTPPDEPLPAIDTTGEEAA